MKPLVFVLAAFAMIATVEARQSSGAAKAAQAQKAKLDKEKAERDRKRGAVKELLDSKDTNHDGSLTKDEYIAGEADADAAGKRFDQFNKNKDRYLQKEEIEALLGL